jgi:predicted CoA-binding protein
MVVAVVGASKNRNKFGNKAVRAYAHQGFDVYPVNPNDETIEGLKAYRSVLDIPVEIDRVAIYLPPERTLGILDEIAKKGTKELYLNPGTEDQRVVDKATALGLEPILACSIIAIDDSPSNYS